MDGSRACSGDVDVVRKGATGVDRMEGIAGALPLKPFRIRGRRFPTWAAICPALRWRTVSINLMTPIDVCCGRKIAGIRTMGNSLVQTKPVRRKRRLVVFCTIKRYFQRICEGEDRRHPNTSASYTQSNLMLSAAKTHRSVVEARC